MLCEHVEMGLRNSTWTKGIRCARLHRCYGCPGFDPAPRAGALNGTSSPKDVRDPLAEAACSQVSEVATRVGVRQEPRLSIVAARLDARGTGYPRGACGAAEVRRGRFTLPAVSPTRPRGHSLPHQPGHGEHQETSRSIVHSYRCWGGVLQRSWYVWKQAGKGPGAQWFVCEPLISGH